MGILSCEIAVAEPILTQHHGGGGGMCVSKQQRMVPSGIRSGRNYQQRRLILFLKSIISQSVTVVTLDDSRPFP